MPNNDMTCTAQWRRIPKSISSEKTYVTYTEESGIPDWEGVITGALGDRAIPDMDFVETVEVGNRVTRILTGAF